MKKIRREITDKELEILKEYNNTLDVTLLENISNPYVAHTIDVILKEAIRTWNNDDLSFGMNKEGTFTGSFETNYELFNPNLIFFANDRSGEWPFPITIYKNKNDGLKTNWKNHNYFFIDHYEYLDFDGLLANFSQDIDIFGNKETWKWNLLKALFMVVYAAYEYWEMVKLEENEFDENLL